MRRKSPSWVEAGMDSTPGDNPIQITAHPDKGTDVKTTIPVKVEKFRHIAAWAHANRPSPRSSVRPSLPRSHIVERRLYYL